ncbi:MAG: IS1634 family transposase, partial [Methanomicrobiales archaeon]
FVLSQIKKPTQNPTLKWICFKFRGVIEFKIRVNNSEVSRIGNMKPELAKIVSLLEAPYEKYYF